MSAPQLKLVPSENDDASSPHLRLAPAPHQHKYTVIVRRTLTADDLQTVADIMRDRLSEAPDGSEARVTVIPHWKVRLVHFIAGAMAAGYLAALILHIFHRTLF